MPRHDQPHRPALFSRTLRECEQLYRRAAERLITERPDLAPIPDETRRRMLDLHRGVALKVYLTVCEADGRWSREERLLAEVLCHHLWGRWIEGVELREVMKRASADCQSLEWSALTAPFRQRAALQDRTSELETIVTRLANLIARCDGSLCGAEQSALQQLERELQESLPLSAEEPPPTPTPTPSPAPATDRPGSAESAAPQPDEADALEELEKLIGLAAIKQEVRSLVNFLRLQQKREAAGLPQTELCLHMVFVGNPGVGKTTVARIVGRVLAGLGVLEKGHLIETDRAGLVAEYAGQTAPRTNAKIDEAQGGVLFIDEAYSLVAKGSEDPYGREALQALLKRAEDDRDSLVVILAGYPDEMDELLAANPGLSSRFARRLEFVDYAPLELAQIFGLLCEHNHYKLTPGARLRVLSGMGELHRRRDRHFGNGRESRNLFEHAVRRMANRLASDASVDPTELVTLQAADIEFVQLPDGAPAQPDDAQVELTCPACGVQRQAPAEFLGRRLKCPQCEAAFVAEWGPVVG